MSFLQLTKPGLRELELFVSLQQAQPVTYEGPLVPTPGFRFSQKRWSLGNGPKVFAKAVSGLAAWAVYPPWLTRYPAHAPLREGVVVALVARTFPVWTLSAMRITDLERTPQRVSFTLGTLPQHAVSGRERFSVSLAADGRVWYELTALSVPRQPLVKLAAPVLRMVQARFARDSRRSLERFVGSIRH